MHLSIITIHVAAVTTGLSPDILKLMQIAEGFPFINLR